MNSRLRNFLTTGSLSSEEEKTKEVPDGTPTVEPAKPTVEPAVSAPAPAPAPAEPATPAAAVRPTAVPTARPADPPVHAETVPTAVRPEPVPAPARTEPALAHGLTETVRPAPAPAPAPAEPAAPAAAVRPTPVAVSAVRPSQPSAPRPARAGDGSPVVAPVNPTRNSEPDGAVRSELIALRTEVAALKTAEAQYQAALRSDYLTSRDQLKVFQAAFERRDAEMANKQLMGLLEQVSIMREDFFRLCDGMAAKIGNFTAQEVLDSFKAYEVDMENILHDTGVTIGPYGGEDDRINTLHQRIVGIVPTNDPDRNGRIAERLADGYEYHGRVLLKEKVNVFKTTEMPVAPAPAEPAAGPAPAPVPDAEAAVPAAAPAPAEPGTAKKRAPRKRRSAKKGTKSAENANDLTDGKKTEEE